MFARIVEFEVKLEKKEEFLRTVQNEILPLLRQQPGFVEILHFHEEDRPKKVVAISLWHTKRDAERFAEQAAHRVGEIAKPYLAAPIIAKIYALETAITKHFVDALVA
jgi:heme-degrading monooxygenase HmoA